MGEYEEDVGQEILFAIGCLISIVVIILILCLVASVFPRVAGYSAGIICVIALLWYLNKDNENTFAEANIQLDQKEREAFSEKTAPLLIEEEKKILRDAFSQKTASLLIEQEKKTLFEKAGIDLEQH